MQPVKVELTPKDAHKQLRLGQVIRASKNRKLRQEIASIKATTAKINAAIKGQ